MFVLDPARGNRRRALIRAKAVWAAKKVREAAGATSRDLRNRVIGLRARGESLLADDTADDFTITERVRTALGRTTNRHRAISVTVSDGCVTLSGDALASEVPQILSTVRSVRGVEGVCDDLRVHASANGIPSLRGESTARSRWMTRGASRWAAAAAGIGVLAMATAVRRRET